MRPLLLLVFSWLALGVAAAAAQSPGIRSTEPEPAEPRMDVGPSVEGHEVGGYSGVVPGSGHTPPRAPRPGQGTTLMTWPGFQARPDGATRFFVQTTGPVLTETLREEGRVVILLRDTRIHLRNNRRPLETRFFNTPVNRAWVERRGRDVAIVLELRVEVTPQVRSEAAPNGYHFVFMAFAAGDYVPQAAADPLQHPATPEPTAPTHQGMTPGGMGGYADDERPPTIGPNP